MVSSTRRLDRIMSSRRAPPGITQTPSLPFIYCVFNSERAARVCLGGPRGPQCPRAGSRGPGVGGLKAGADMAPLSPRAPLLPALLLHLPGPEPDVQPRPDIPG